MRTHTFAAVLLAAIFNSTPAFSDDLCYERSGQFAKMRHCVTSVRPPEGATNFGPEHLAATDDGAWCANAADRQTITMYLNPAPPLRTVSMTNGYAKSAEIFR
jgi:hypothetical protein